LSIQKKGIKVNSFLQSLSNPNIYAAGDAADTSGLPLTPVAVLEGHTVASNIIKGNKKEISYPPMPTIVFTLPTLASVGLKENEAKEKGYQVEINYQDAGDWFNAKRLNINQYVFKTIIDKEKQTLIGAHLIGPSSDEIINIFALAIKTKISINDFRKMIFAYPTMASDIPHML